MALNVLEAERGCTDTAGEGKTDAAQGAAQAASGRVSHNILDGDFLDHATPAVPPK
jgi:hypothetical protein